MHRFSIKSTQLADLGQEPFCRAGALLQGKRYLEHPGPPTWEPKQTLAPPAAEAATAESRAKQCTQVSYPIPNLHGKDAYNRNLTRNQRA